LARYRCLAVLRATYDDATQSLAVTVGVVVLPGPAAASASLEALRGQNGKNPRPGVRAVSFRRTPVARFGNRQRQLSSVRRVGPPAGRRRASGGRRVRVVAPLAGAVLAAAALCAVTVLPAQADAVRDQEMWVLDMVHAPSAWPVTQGQGVLVAVIDSGVFPSVSDLAGSVTEGPNLSGVSTPQSNTSWGVHGTWMASLIAGHGHGDGSA